MIKKNVKKSSNGYKFGEKALAKYNTFDLTEDDQGNLIKMIEVFENPTEV